MSSRLLLGLLTDNGTASGSPFMNINGSVTSKLFYVQPPSNETWFLNHFHITIGCAAAPAVSEYGSIVGGLTNGLICERKNAGVIENPFSGYAFKKNFNFGIFWRCNYF